MSECRACLRDEPCDLCDGEGCGGCVQTGKRHTFKEAIAHITGLPQHRVDAAVERIADRL